MAGGKTKPFIKKTFINGIIFLVPVVAIAWLFSGAIGAVAPLYTGLQTNDTIKKIGGPILMVLIVLAFVVLLVFFTGILIHFTLLQKANTWLEKQVLGVIPGYDLYKTMLEERLHIRHCSGQAVLVQWADSQQLGLKTEDHEDGTCTVYFPYSALTGGGAVHIINKSKIIELNMTLMEMEAIFNRLGAGMKNKKQTTQ